MAGLPATESVVISVPELAARALRLELDLTPKPGLVDRANNGSHQDMDHALFLRSIAAITPWFSVFEQAGREHAHKAAGVQLRLLRPAGIACEQAMFAATGGVNTHKGGIFRWGCSVLPPDDCRDNAGRCRPKRCAGRSVKSVAGWWRVNWRPGHRL